MPLKVRDQKTTEVRQCVPLLGCSVGSGHKKSQPDSGWLLLFGGGGGS